MPSNVTLEELDFKLDLIIGKLEYNERLVKDMAEITKNDYVQLLDLVRRLLQVNPQNAGAQAELETLRAEYAAYKQNHAWLSDPELDAQTDTLMNEISAALPNVNPTATVTDPTGTPVAVTAETSAPAVSGGATFGASAVPAESTPVADAPVAETPTVDNSDVTVGQDVTTVDGATNQHSANAAVQGQPMPDGSTLMPDGTRIFADGSKINADGSRTDAQGRTVAKRSGGDVPRSGPDGEDFAKTTVQTANAADPKGEKQPSVEQKPAGQ